MKRYALALLIVLLSLSNQVYASSWLDLDIFERDDGNYFTLQTKDGEVITMTARILDIGDSYIDAKNNRYEVVGFDGDIVQVELKEQITLPDINEWLTTQAAKENTGNKWNTIGIYHTHNAESYVPTSGVDSEIEGGDIMEVGKTLANALKEQGFEVIWSDNSHLPHDGQAYTRSRRTVMELLQHQPATLIDVHRDATPPEVYETEIEGVPTTKVRIVVGRQNQNREANLEYAKRLKAVADQEYPGIIEGIFDARGNYNQDIGPRIILLEFGAHTNPLEMAEQAAEFFAKVIPAAAGITKEDTAQDNVGFASARSIVWILAIVAVLGIGFIFLNRQRI
ncbi:MAG: hypothetical protein GX208_04615 [Firmicutes bacterium]|nr:hypothetical protein [Bacillota bacterium]